MYANCRHMLKHVLLWKREIHAHTHSHAGTHSVLDTENWMNLLLVPLSDVTCWTTCVEAYWIWAFTSTYTPKARSTSRWRQACIHLCVQFPFFYERILHKWQTYVGCLNVFLNITWVFLLVHCAVKVRNKISILIHTRSTCIQCICIMYCWYLASISRSATWGRK
jgi:hypothetical protein